MSVNQDNNTLAKRKRQITEIPKEHGFLDERVRTLKSSRSSCIGKITYNINKIFTKLRQFLTNCKIVFFRNLLKKKFSIFTPTKGSE